MPAYNVTNNPTSATAQDYINDIWGRAYTGPAPPLWSPQQAGVQGARAALYYGEPASQLGYGSLAQMLATQGHIDPRVMSNNLRINARQTQQTANTARANLGARGWGNLGLGQALQGAIQQGGSNAAANIRYKDSSDAYARQQGNLGLLKDLVVDPRRDYAAMAAGQYGNDQHNATQKKSAITSAVAAIVAALLCKVAKELYGNGSKKFEDARHYMVHAAPAGMATSYLLHGDELAAAVRTDPAVRARMTPVFDEYARRGAAMRH